MALSCRTGQRLRRCRSGGKGLGRRLQKEGAPVWIKPLQPGFARGKQANRPSGVGNAPLLPTAPLHGKASHEIFSRLMAPYKFRSLATPEGEVLAMLYIAQLKLALRPEESRLPPPGEVVRSTDRGEFPTGASPVGLFFNARQGGCMVLSLEAPYTNEMAPTTAAPAARPYILIARRAIPQPSARRAVKLKNPKNLRAEGPSTLTACVRVHEELRFFILFHSLPMCGTMYRA